MQEVKIKEKASESFHFMLNVDVVCAMVAWVLFLTTALVQAATSSDH